MSWVTIIWSMIAATCLTLAAIYFLVWCQRRTAWDILLLTLSSAAVAVYTGCELCMLRAETPAHFATALRWLHVPVWVLILSLVGFVRLRLRAGRPWLAWTICALRTLALLLNFLVGQNLNYREVTRLRHIPLLGESASIAEGVQNPWMLVAQLSLLLFVIFTADAALSVWRRGDRRQALVTCGSILFFALASIVESLLVLWQLVDWPLTACFCFLGIVLAMGYEMSRETLRAAQLSDDLRESEARMALAAEAAGFGVWMWTFATNRVWGSERWLRLFGFGAGADVTYEQVFQRIHPDDRERVESEIRHAVETGANYVGEYRGMLPDGTVYWIAARGRVDRDGAGKPARMVGAALDITPRKQAELDSLRHRQELAHVSRVSIMGELSASMAHELNQPLTAILSNAQAAQRFMASGQLDPAEHREILKDIVQDTTRARDVIRHLRTLVKKSEREFVRVDINEIVGQVVGFLHGDIVGRNVSVTQELAPELPIVLGDRTQLQQVLLNLLLNAFDAVNGNPVPGRQVTVLTAMGSADLVRVAVRDGGVGIQPDKLDQIFHPFFTTKAAGLGMGLAVSRSIIEGHGGRLLAENNPEQGATFSFTLPVAEGKSDH